MKSLKAGSWQFARYLLAAATFAALAAGYLVTRNYFVTRQNHAMQEDLARYYAPKPAR